MKPRFLIIIALLLVACWASGALSDTISFDLTSINISGFTGPYINVEVNRKDDKHATITFTSLTNSSGQVYRMGCENSADLNVNASAFTVDNLSGFIDPKVGSGEVDGWGNFNLTIKNFDGFKDSFTLGSFIVGNTSGFWAMANEVLTPNKEGYTAAAHILVANANGTNTGITGYAAGVSHVPIPPTALLLASGLLGLVSWRRFRT